MVKEAFLTFCLFLAGQQKETHYLPSFNTAMRNMNSYLGALSVLCLCFLHADARILHASPIVSSAVKLRIGTRGSPLALAQAYETKSILRKAFPEFQHEDSIEIKRINTQVSIVRLSVFLHNPHTLISVTCIFVFL